MISFVVGKPGDGMIWRGVLSLSCPFPAIRARSYCAVCTLYRDCSLRLDRIT